MQQGFNITAADAAAHSEIGNRGDILDRVAWLCGDKNRALTMPGLPALKPFDDGVVELLNALSRRLMRMPEAKAYPDVVTLGFWCRKASVLGLKGRFASGLDDDDIVVGRGVAFHIAPSNVPVNYAYSLVAGLLTGNANVVRIPSREFPQVDIINRALNEVLEDYPELAPYICLVRYERNQEINDVFSAMADTRIIWGGDSTIEEIRKSPLGPRAGEVTFADRYSLAVIDSGAYLAVADKKRLAEDFYNDTFLTDQNACTSPRVVVWLGDDDTVRRAQDEFWDLEHYLVKEKYTFQPIMGVNKLTSGYLAAAVLGGETIRVIPAEDNLIVRVAVSKAALTPALMDLRDNSGYFYEYTCSDVMDLRDICNDTHCQTIAYLGDREVLMPLLTSGIKGVDRVVPIGKTMDFDLIWDGYNLVERLTRRVRVG